MKIAYLWYPNHIGSFEKIVDTCVMANLDIVSVKVANGILPYPNNINILPLVKMLKEEGIKVWGWHYVYSSNEPEKEALIARNRMFELDLDGYEIDAEAHYKNAGFQQSSKLVSLIKSAAREKGIKLGVTTYRYPNYHKELSWRAFLDVDFWVPQVYWNYNTPTSHIAELNESMRQWNQLAEELGISKKPIIPAGRLYYGDGYPAGKEDTLSGQIVSFADYCQSQGLDCHWWSLDNLFNQSNFQNERKTAFFSFYKGENPEPQPQDPDIKELKHRVSQLETQIANIMTAISHLQDDISEIQNALESLLQNPPNNPFPPMPTEYKLYPKKEKVVAFSYKNKNANGLPIMNINVYAETKDPNLRKEPGGFFTSDGQTHKSDGGKLWYSITNVDKHGYPDLFVEASKVTKTT